MEFNTLLIHWEWKGIVLLTLAACFLWCMRKRSASQRHLFLFSALLSLLLIPVAHRWLSNTSSNRFQIIPPSGWEKVEDTFQIGVDKLWLTKSTDQVHRSDDSAMVKASTNFDPKTLNAPGSVFKIPELRWGFVWLLGFILLMGRIGWQSLMLFRLVRKSPEIEDGRLIVLFNQAVIDAGLSRTPKLIKVSLFGVPATWGWFRPAIALPEEATSWSSETLKTVLDHECSHIKRRDYFCLNVAKMIRALTWCNPLSWWAIRRLRADMELACDEQVIANGTSPTHYAQTLLNIARAGTHYSRSSVMLMATKSNLQRRVEAAVIPKRDVGSDGWRLQWLSLLSIASFALMIGCQTAAQTQSLSNAPLINSIEPDVDRRLKSYFQVRMERTEQFIEEDQLDISGDSDILQFYKHGIDGKWEKALTLARRLVEIYRKHLTNESDNSIEVQHKLLQETIVFHPFMECHKALEACANWDQEQIEFLIQNTIETLPEKKGILVWDEKAGGNLMSLYADSETIPMKLTMIDINSLADNRYFEYLRRTTSSDIVKLPSDSDHEMAFISYMSDAANRHRSGDLLKGENVSISSDGRVAVQGHIAVLGVSQYVIEWIAENNKDTSLYFAGSYGIPNFRKKLQPFGCLTRFWLNEHKSTRVVNMNTIISKWRGLFKENTGVDVSREACFEYITALNRDGIEQFNKKHFANSVSGEAWAKLRLSQILTRIHRVEMGPNTKFYSPPNEHIAQLTYEQLVRVVDEGFLQALTWHPMSEDVVSEYSAFLEMVDDVQWGKEISTLSAHIKAVDNKNKSE